MSQYADETTLILDGSKTSLSTSLKVLEYFSREISGLRLNPQKKKKKTKKKTDCMDWGKDMLRAEALPCNWIEMVET